MRADVGQPQRPRIVDQHTEHAAPAGQVADRSMRLLVDARGEEPLEQLAPLVEHADRRVARAGQLARDLEQLIEHDLRIELGDQRAPDGEQPAQPWLLHLAHTTAALARKGLGRRRSVRRHDPHPSRSILRPPTHVQTLVQLTTTSARAAVAPGKLLAIRARPVR